MVLSTKGLSVAQQQAVLAELSLANATGKLTTAQMTEILTTKSRSKADAEALLLNAGLITSETAEATATNVVAAAKLKELVQTKALTQAEAELIAAKAGVTLANQKESTSFLAGIGSKIKGLGSGLKSAGTGILALAKAHPVIAGITTALTIGTVAVGIYKKKQEEAAQAIKEAYENAKTAIDEITSTFENTKSTTESIAKEYAELAQGVNLLTNENKKLSTEKYERFLELSNQLSGLYPSLTKDFDDNGNAILDLSGDVDTIVGSLNDLVSVQEQLANQKIVDQMPVLFKGYRNNVSDFKEQLDNAEKTKSDIEKAYEVLNNWDSSTVWWANGGNVSGDGTMGEYVNALETLGIAYKKVAVDLNNDSYKNSDGFSIEADYDEFGTELHDIYVDKFNKASDEVKYAKMQLESETSSISQYLNTWLQTEFSYNQLENDGLKQVIRELLFNFDWNSLPKDIDKNDWGAVSEYLRRNILFSVNNIDDVSVSQALADIYTGALSSGDLLTAIEKVQNYFGDEHPILLSLEPKVGDVEPLMNSVKDKLKGTEFDDKVGELSLGDLETAAGLKVSDDSIHSWDELLERIQKVKSETFSDEITVSNIFELEDSEGNLTTLGKISEELDTIQNAYKTLSSAIDEYNANGSISVDTLQSVIGLGDGWIDHLVDEEGNLRLDQEALESLTTSRINDMRVQAINNAIDNVKKIENDIQAKEYLAQANEDLAKTYKTVGQASLFAALNQLKAKGVSEEHVKQIESNALSTINKINSVFSKVDISSFGLGGSSSGDDITEYFNNINEAYDNQANILSKRIDNINDEISKLGEDDGIVSDAVFDKAIEESEQLLSVYQDQRNALFDELNRLVYNGSVEYLSSEWYDMYNKILSCDDAIKDTTESIEDLVKQAKEARIELFDILNSRYNERMNVFDYREDELKHQIEILETTDSEVDKSLYEALAENTRIKIDALNQQRRELTAKLNELVKNGDVEMFSSKWYEMYDDIQNVNSELNDSNLALIEFSQSIEEIDETKFDKLVDKISNFKDELSSIIDILSNEDLVKYSDGQGVFTKEGITTLAMYVNQMNLAKQSIDEYVKREEELERAYKSGSLSLNEYTEKMAEVRSGHFDEINSYNEAINSIKELNEERINAVEEGMEKEYEAYEKIINLKKEALNSEKELYNFQKEISQKSKSITNVDRQIAALSADGSSSAKVQLAKLKQEREDAQSELDDYIMENSISRQTEMLDNQLEAYKTNQESIIESMRATVNDTDAMIASSTQLVLDNTNLVSLSIMELENEFKIDLTDAITTTLNNGKISLSSFDTSLNTTKTNTDSVTQSLEGMSDVELEDLYTGVFLVSEELKNEKEQADLAQGSLMNMINAPTDNLVGKINIVSSSLDGVRTFGDAATESINNLNDALYTYDGIRKKVVTDDPNRPFNPTEETYGDYLIRTGKLLPRYASGGVVGDKKHPLDEILAKPYGEDHVGLLKEGEVVLTKLDQQKIFDLINPNFTPTFTPVQLPKLSLPNNNTGNQLIIEGNLVNVEGSVNDYNMKAIQKQIDTSINKTMNYIVKGHL